LPDVFPIIGGSRASQIEDSMKGADIAIEKDELSEIFCDYKIN
jgi:aryl-alcohol dehydrogenase-like predicted oxidoreductase